MDFKEIQEWRNKLKKETNKIDPASLVILQKICPAHKSYFTEEFYKKLLAAKDLVFEFLKKNKDKKFNPKAVFIDLDISEYQFVLSIEYLLAEGKLKSVNGDLKLV